MSDEGQKRSVWFLFTGLIMGALIGLGYAWFLDPVAYRDVSPDHLRENAKEQYRGLIALAYSSNGDRGRAEARMKLLGDRDASEALAAQAQRFLGGVGPFEEARAMAQLAADLRKPAAPTVTMAETVEPTRTKAPISSPEAATATLQPSLENKSSKTPPAASATPAATRTTFPTFTPGPTLAPSATPGSSYRLIGQSEVCDTNLPEGLLQVIVEDSSGAGVAGVGVVVTWNGGEDLFYTGLAPEIDPGYADFVMAPGTTYTLRAGEGGEVIDHLLAKECAKPDGSKYLGGLKLRLKQ